MGRKMEVTTRCGSSFFCCTALVRAGGLLRSPAPAWVRHWPFLPRDLDLNSRLSGKPGVSSQMSPPLTLLGRQGAGFWGGIHTSRGDYRGTRPSRGTQLIHSGHFGGKEGLLMGWAQSSVTVMRAWVGVEGGSSQGLEGGISLFLM